MYNKYQKCVTQWRMTMKSDIIYSIIPWYFGTDSDNNHAEINIT